MSGLFEVSEQAQEDLFEIWSRIAADSVDLADRIESEFYELFASLGRMPHQGQVRKDLTNRPVRFFTMYSFLVVYRPDLTPIRILTVMRGRRDAKAVLKERL